MTRTMIRVAAMALVAGFWATEAVAQDHSWLWPLYTKVDPDPGGSAKGEPRPAVWGGTGEYQYYGDAPYMHPGSDIRGAAGDPVIVPVDSRILATFRFQDDCLADGGFSCRV